MMAAPKTRRAKMSSGNKVCEADARATTMNEVQIEIVISAAATPIQGRGEGADMVAFDRRGCLCTAS